MKTQNSFFLLLAFVLSTTIVFTSCGRKQEGSPNLSDNAAEKVYVAPGEHDEFYAFVSGGFSGQMSVYGLPSGRLFRIIPVFSVHPENGYGFSEETKPMLMTSHGFVPWDDSHHSELSQTDGVPDGRWIFINGNNTPRVARIDLRTFETAEIIELPNSAGNHSSPFITPNSEYIVAGTRFSLPIPNQDVPIDTYKDNFKGTVSFISIDKEDGNMDIAFQIILPGFNFDLSHAGKGPSDGWFFFSCYNTELAHTLLEINASQNDKDFILAINWKKAEELIRDGKFNEIETEYFNNEYDETTHTATSNRLTKVKTITAKDSEGLAYLIPCPKSPHGCDVDPSGEYIVGGGKLATVIPVFSFSKMIKAIEGKSFDGDYDGIPVLQYDAVLAGEVKEPGLGPLHTEFDDNGNAYTSMFVSSEIVKWKVATQEVLDRVPVYYSIGHLLIPGGDSKKPWGKYVLVMNKITKDRFLPTGPELVQSSQLYDISGDKMVLLGEFPTIGEPHYAQAMPTEKIMENSLKIYKIGENNHPHAIKNEKDAKVVRESSNVVRVYMTSIRSHLTPDNIEGIQVGDTVYFHVTNLEQDWDIPHGFAIKGNNNAELLIMPGQTRTLKWIANSVGIVPYYCTDFCSALHQEMTGYARVSPRGSGTPILFRTGDNKGNP